MDGGNEGYGRKGRELQEMRLKLGWHGFTEALEA
jgi:hypothetical protein